MIGKAGSVDAETSFVEELCIRKHFQVSDVGWVLTQLCYGDDCWVTTQPTT